MTESIARDPGASAPASAAQAKRAWRATLLAARAEIALRDPDAAARLNRRLAGWLEAQDARCLAFYWPMRDEPDLRGTVGAWLARDTRRRAALPVIDDPRGPLRFHRWTPDAPMQAGRYGIPVPADGERVAPALLLIPCVGFDARGLRLGYGGGFYDRTLAAAAPRPRTLGIAFAACRVAALPGEAHDLPLDHILTDAGMLDAPAPTVNARPA